MNPFPRWFLWVILILGLALLAWLLPASVALLVEIVPSFIDYFG